MLVNSPRPLRDVSLSDFAWVAQQAIYTNPVVVTRPQLSTDEQNAVRH
jgi:hypothetical protein